MGWFMVWLNQPGQHILIEHSADNLDSNDHLGDLDWSREEMIKLSGIVVLPRINMHNDL
jgi:hypothetical protein